MAVTIIRKMPASCTLEDFVHQNLVSSEIVNSKEMARFINFFSIFTLLQIDNNHLRLLFHLNSNRDIERDNSVYSRNIFLYGL